MFIFASETSLAHSPMFHCFNTGGQDTGSALLHLFDSEPPASINDLPFDYNDAFEIQKHSVANSEVSVTRLHQGSKNFYHIAGDTDFGTYIHGYNKKWNKWQLVPNRMVNLRYWTEDEVPQPTSETYGDDDSEMRTHHFFYRYDSRIRRYDDHMLKNSNNYGGSALDDASPTGYMLTYDQPVTVDQLVYKAWTSASNVPSLWTIQYWDDSLNDGNGDWVTAVDQHRVYDTIYDAQLFIKFDAVTSRKFKLLWNGTGNSTFALNQIQLYGSEPTWGTTPRTVKWALVQANWNLYNSYFPRSNASAYVTAKPGYPTLLLSVGTTGDGNSAALEFDTLNATNQDVPRLQRGFLEISNSF